MFEGKYESFAVVKQSHSITLILYYVVALVTSNSIEIKYLMMGLFLFVIPSVYFLRKLPEKDEKLLSVLTEEESGTDYT